MCVYTFNNKPYVDIRSDLRIYLNARKRGKCLWQYKIKWLE